MASSHVSAVRAALIGGAPSSSDLKPALIRLLAEMKRRADKGRSPAFFVDAAQALCAIRGKALAEERLECLVVAIGVLITTGMHRESISAAKSALTLSALVTNPRSSRLAHSLLGAAYAEAGDLANAVTHHGQALTAAVELRDNLSQAIALNNLGNSLNHAGLFHDAIPCLLRAAQIFEISNEAHPLKASVLCNLANSYLQIGDLPAAQRQIDQALTERRSLLLAIDVYNFAVRNLVRAKVEIGLDNRAAARAAVDECKNHAQSLGGTRAAAVATMAEALYQARYGDVTSVIPDLESICGNHAFSWSERNEAYPILITAYDEVGRPDEALLKLQEWLAELRKLRAQTLDAVLPSDSKDGKHGKRSETVDLQQISIQEYKLRASAAQRELILAQLETLERLAISADLREESSGEHGFRVGTLTRMICEQLGHTKAESYSAEVAARLHDLGKISLPDRIMLRPGALAEVERQFVCAHTRVGAELLSNGRSPELRLAQAIALHHHEWWNGEGYPSKLSGTRIPIHARIVALADVFDALTHGRPYAPAWPVEKALAEIRSRRGTQFDPELTDVFLNLMERLVNEHEDLDAYLGRESRHSPFLQARNKIRQMLEAERENEKKATVEGNLTRH